MKFKEQSFPCLPIQMIEQFKVITGSNHWISREKVRSAIPLYNKGVSMFFVEQPSHIETIVLMSRK